MRRRIEALVPVKPRANTDMYAPYLEALSEVRLGLVDPNVIEAQRDDVAGFGAMFDEYRDKLHADRRDRPRRADLRRDRGAACATPDVRRAFQREARHLLVDEFQDLTPAQLLLLRLVAAPAYDVFGVGDDDQVIYGYAGADPEFLINYDRYFPGGTHHTLATNYRCPAPVVAATRNLLSYNRRRIDKEIVAAKTDRRRDDDALTIVDRRRRNGVAHAAVERVTAWLDAGAQPERHRGAEPRELGAAPRAAAPRRSGRAVLDAGERRGAQPHRHAHRARLSPARARRRRTTPASTAPTSRSRRGVRAGRCAGRCCSGSNASGNGACRSCGARPTR